MLIYYSECSNISMFTFKEVIKMDYKESNSEFIAQELKEESYNTEYQSQFAELGYESQQEVKVKKKKFPVYIPIIIAAFVLLASIVVFLAINILTPTVEGTWVYEGEDGTKMYYTFNNDECDMNVGTLHFPGKYTASNDESGKNINVEIYAGYIYGTCQYEVTGNRLAKNRVLTLVTAEGTEYVLNETKAQKDSDYILPDENFEEVEELTGEWEFYYVEYDSSIKLTFNDDGTMSLNQFGYQDLHCVYTVNDSKINISYWDTELQTQEEEFYFKDGQLIMMNLNWTRVGESTADEK